MLGKGILAGDPMENYMARETISNRSGNWVSQPRNSSIGHDSILANCRYAIIAPHFPDNMAFPQPEIEIYRIGAAAQSPGRIPGETMNFRL